MVIIEQLGFEDSRMITTKQISEQAYNAGYQQALKDAAEAAIKTIKAAGTIEVGWKHDCVYDIQECDLEDIAAAIRRLSE